MRGAGAVKPGAIGGGRNYAAGHTRARTRPFQSLLLAQEHAGFCPALEKHAAQATCVKRSVVDVIR